MSMPEYVSHFKRRVASIKQHCGRSLEDALTTSLEKRTYRYSFNGKLSTLSTKSASAEVEQELSLSQYRPEFLPNADGIKGGIDLRPSKFVKKRKALKPIEADV